MIIKFYIEDPKAYGPINYAIGEVFRYLDHGFRVVEDYEEADVIYGSSPFKGSKHQLRINPSKEVWDAYLSVSNLNKVIDYVVNGYEELSSGNIRSHKSSTDILFFIFFSFFWTCILTPLPIWWNFSHHLIKHITHSGFRTVAF